MPFIMGLMLVMFAGPSVLPCSLGDAWAADGSPLCVAVWDTKLPRRLESSLSGAVEPCSILAKARDELSMLQPPAHARSIVFIMFSHSDFPAIHCLFLWKVHTETRVTDGDIREPTSFGCAETEPVRKCPSPASAAAAGGSAGASAVTGTSSTLSIGLSGPSA